MDNALDYYQHQLNQPRLIHSADTQLDQLIIELVDTVIKSATDMNASDIHIEPANHNCRIRFRCDGILYEKLCIPKHMALRVVTRLKIMANMDIGEKRLPQDGRILYSECDMRISTCPALYGEKVVLRLLSDAKLPLTLDQLGLSDHQYNLLQHHLQQPHGLILVTGATGSGKTATLYAALQYLNTSERNIVTIEDPIEITLPGITQININPRIGLHFSTILRNVLRQDPDIIMLGEIRDAETAAMALQAAQTGHLVLTTLHANNIETILPRLTSLGLASHDLLTSLSLMISQRLVRKKTKGRTGIFSLATIENNGNINCQD